MADIFLSYKTEDRAVADSLVRVLEASGFSVWWDQRIGAGEMWRSEITDQLQRAKCVIVLWTRHSAGKLGRFVQEEAALAQRLGTYLPVKIEECDLPLGFSEMQALALFDWSGRLDHPVLARLVDLAREIIAAPASPVEATSKVEPPVSVRSERRSVTVLRAVLVRPAKSLDDPEHAEEFIVELAELLHQTLDHRTSLCQELDASGFTCIFGVPAADELEPVRAVEKALLLEELLRGRMGVAARFGLATGTAVTTPRMPGTPPRVTSNLKARAEEVLEGAPTGTVFIPADMKSSIDAFFVTQAAGERRFAVTGRTAVHGRSANVGEAGISPFSGRAAELGHIEGAILSAVQGSGQALSLVGEAGLGKTRLVHETVSRIEKRGFTMLETTCIAFGRSKPLGAIVDLLRQLLMHEGEEGATAVDAAAIQATFPALEPYVEVLSRLIAPSEGLQPLPYEQDAQSMRREATIAAITVAAERQPLAIIIDDFHFADEATQEIIGPLAEAIAYSRVLLVIAARPSVAPAWPPVVHCRQLVLPPLDAHATGELLLAVTGARSLRAGLAKLIWGLTDGVPLFVEELARAMIEHSQLQLVEGQLTLLAGAEYSSPRSLEALIRARLDRLEPDLRALLQTASAIGRQFDWKLLRGLIGTDQAPAALLGPALVLGLVERVRLLPEPVYRFRQHMIHVVAHDSILKSERRELHRRIGEQIEAECGDRKDERLEELAYHFADAEVPDKAVRYLLAAGKRALGWGSAQVAADLAARALVFVETPSAKERDHDQLLMAYVILGNALTLSRGYFDRELAVIVEKARALGPDVGSEQVQLATTWWLWRHYYNCLMLDEAAECVTRLSALGASTGSAGIRLAAIGAKGIVAHFRGEVEASVRHLQEAVSLWDAKVVATEDGGVGLVGSVMSHVFLGFTRVMQCRLREAWSAFDAAERIAEAARQPDLELFYLSYRQMALTMLGRFEDAVPLNNQALALANKHDRHSWESVNRIVLGRLMLERGDLQGTKAILNEMEQAVSIGGGVRALYHVLRLLDAFERKDNKAIASAAEALAKGMERTGVRLFVVDVALARATLEWPSDPQRAYAEARAVMTQVAATGSRIGHFRMASHLAQLLLADGEADEAARILKSALAPLDRSELAGCPIFDSAWEALDQPRVEASPPPVRQGTG